MFSASSPWATRSRATFCRRSSSASASISIRSGSSSRCSRSAASSASSACCWRVPAAAVIGVLVRFAVARYLASPLYDPRPMTAQLPVADLPPSARRWGASDFLVAPANEAAVAWLDRWPDWPAPALALAGPAGSGKTHLAPCLRGARSGAVLLAPEALRRAAPRAARRRRARRDPRRRRARRRGGAAPSLQSARRARRPSAAAGARSRRRAGASRSPICARGSWPRRWPSSRRPTTRCLRRCWSSFSPTASFASARRWSPISLPAARALLRRGRSAPSRRSTGPRSPQHRRITVPLARRAEWLRRS